MSDFGGKLRQARERRGISLRQIAIRTKISVVALEALERNDISRLPGGVFSRSFVRSYAIEVGLEPDETVRQFLERYRDEPPPDRLPVVEIPPEEIAFEASKQRAARVFLAAIALLLVIAAVIVYVLLRNRPDDGRDPQAARPPGQTVQAGTARLTGHAAPAHLR